jgi:hypothetical protein
MDSVAGVAFAATESRSGEANLTTAVSYRADTLRGELPDGISVAHHPWK